MHEGIEYPVVVRDGSEIYGSTGPDMGLTTRR